MSKLHELSDKIKDQNLRDKVIEVLENPSGDLGYPCLPLEVCPAGAYHHHSYEGGLLQHTISVVEISLTLCDLVEDNYGGEVDRDVVLAGAILHDVMKCYCYEETMGGGFKTSELGSKVDHLTLIVAELYKRSFPLNIIHVVASHHGDVGATKPKTIEALIVALADQTDSDLNGKFLRAAEYLLRNSGISRPKLKSSNEALEVVKTKDKEGWEGVHRLIDRDS